jgi:hypothetical protein
VANHTTIEEIIRSEHEDNTAQAKKTVNYVWDTDNLTWLKMAGNASGELVVAPSIPTGGGQGRKTVSTPGVEEALATSTTCERVIISGLIGNSKSVAVGFNGVVAAAGSETGKILYPGDSVEILINNLATIYVDVQTAGDGVAYLYFT